MDVTFKYFINYKDLWRLNGKKVSERKNYAVGSLPGFQKK